MYRESGGGYQRKTNTTFHPDSNRIGGIGTMPSHSYPETTKPQTMTKTTAKESTTTTTTTTTETANRTTTTTMQKTKKKHDRSVLAKRLSTRSKKKAAAATKTSRYRDANGKGTKRRF